MFATSLKADALVDDSEGPRNYWFDPSAW